MEGNIPGIIQILPQYMPFGTQDVAINSGMSVDAVGRVACINFFLYFKSALSYFGQHKEITCQRNAPTVLKPFPIEKNCGIA